MSRLAGAQARRVRGYDTDDALSARAGELSAAYLEGAARPSSVRWRGQPGPAMGFGYEAAARS